MATLELSLADVLAVLSALGCALVGGIFFAFSTFIMKALGRLPAAQGIAAMQSINVVVINPWFMAVFFGTALLCIATAGATAVAGHPGAVLAVAGSVLYVIGTVGVTMAFNVPRNDALAAMPASDPQAAPLWQDYLSTWTAWNTVRTVAALAASAAFMAA